MDVQQWIEAVCSISGLCGNSDGWCAWKYGHSNIIYSAPDEKNNPFGKDVLSRLEHGG